MQPVNKHTTCIPRWNCFQVFLTWNTRGLFVGKKGFILPAPKAQLKEVANTFLKCSWEKKSIN